MWRKDWEYEFVTSDQPLRGLMHCDSKETMLSDAYIGLNGQGIGFYLTVNIMDNFVVDDPHEFFDLL